LVATIPALAEVGRSTRSAAAPDDIADVKMQTAARNSVRFLLNAVLRR